MANTLIKKLKLKRIECIVAPYEADAQLAFLSLNNYVDCVISEDSDLLVFGCKRVLFKMNDKGHGTEISLKNLGNVSSISFKNWSQLMLQEMCVLSGCDYIKSIVGIGLKRAYTLINHYRNIKKAIKYLIYEDKYNVPDGYEINTEKAVLTFRHQIVFDNINRKATNLTPLPSICEYDISFLGKMFTNELMRKIADGEINPVTLKCYEVRKRKIVKIEDSEDNKKQKNGKLITSKYFINKIEKENIIEENNEIKTNKSPFFKSRRLSLSRRFSYKDMKLDKLSQ